MPHPIAVPQGRLHTSKPFKVPGLPASHPLTVYLPPGYERGSGAHPVAVVFDGQNLFHDHGSFSGGWHLHLALDTLAHRGRRVPIVIGVHHGGASRLEELSPWAVSRGGHGRADRLLEWVCGPMMAMVREEMRVLAGPEHTMIGGASLGGLMALYGISRRPDVFGSAMVMSPSLWVAGGAIFEVVRHAPWRTAPRIYLDCGGREARGSAMPTARRMAGLLEAKGLRPDATLMWRPDAKGAHNERNWRRRLPKALRFLYP